MTTSVDCRTCVRFPGLGVACGPGETPALTEDLIVNGRCDVYKSAQEIKMEAKLEAYAGFFRLPTADATMCPACAHPKHLGRVCAHEVDVMVTDAGVEPIRCPCHEEARKASTGKVKGYHLLPWDVLEEIARVYEYGAQKYEANSWRQVHAEEYENAMFRHLKAVKEGKVWDADAARYGFQIRHQAQVVWNAMAWLALTAAPPYEPDAQLPLKL